MLKIRLRRTGSKKDASYRIVVSDSRSRPTGRFLEILGTYDPGTDPSDIRIDVGRAEEWINKGALPSETVKHLLAKAKSAQA